MKWKIADQTLHQFLENLTQTVELHVGRAVYLQVHACTCIHFTSWQLWSCHCRMGDWTTFPHTTHSLKQLWLTTDSIRAQTRKLILLTLGARACVRVTVVCLCHSVCPSFCLSFCLSVIFDTLGFTSGLSGEIAIPARCKRHALVI